MEHEGILAECTELALVAGPSVSVVRALDLLGYTSQSQSWAREVGTLEADILSEMLRDRIPTAVIADRFARVIYVKGLVGDRAAIRRFEQALRQFWQQQIGRSDHRVDANLHGTAQGLLVCAILLDRGDLALEASKHLPCGPWQDLGRAWASNDHGVLTTLERRLVDDIASDERAGSLSILSDGWTYLLLDRIRQRLGHDGQCMEEPLHG